MPYTITTWEVMLQSGLSDSSQGLFGSLLQLGNLFQSGEVLFLSLLFLSAFVLPGGQHSLPSRLGFPWYVGSQLLRVA